MSERIISSIIGFDEIVGGGIKKGSMVLLHGPPFCGKKLLMMQFLYEQLKSSNKVIFILSDFGYKDFVNKMKNFKMDISAFEKNNSVFFIDAYSKLYEPLLQSTDTIKYVSAPSALSEISLSISKITESFNLTNYFVGWHSLSGILSSTSPVSFFKFLSFEIAKFKKANATCLFTLEKNAHSKEHELGVERFMDGILDFSDSKIIVRGFETFDSTPHPYSINENGISIM